MPSQKQKRAHESAIERYLEELEAFVEHLSTVNTVRDALKLVARSPRPFSSNLKFLLDNFEVPGDLSSDERIAYAKMLRRLSKDEALKPGSSDKLLSLAALLSKM